MFTFIRVDTNVHAAFALQFVFVLFNSFQGFVVFICFVVLREDSRTEWLNVVNLCCNKALPNKISRYLTTSTLATKSSAPKSLKHERDQSLSALYVNQNAASTFSQDARNKSPNLMESSVDER